MEASTKSQKFSANLDSLGSIREFLTDSAKLAGLDKSRTYKLCLAIDEIATNIINYGYLRSGIENGTIDVIIQIENDQLIATLEDTATPFNPFDRKMPSDEELKKPLEERPIGGLGILLAKENVDEFNYKYQNNKNRNIFVMNL